MNVKYIIIWCILLSNSLRGQNLFNEVYNYGGGSIATDMVLLDSSFVTMDISDEFPSRLDIIIFDINGSILDTIFHDYSQMVAGGLGVCSDCLIKLESKKTFITSQFHFDSTNLPHIHLVRFNRNFDIVDSISYKVEGNSPGIPRSLKLESDTTFIITGKVFRPADSVLGAFVSKFDTSFRLIWERTIYPDNPNVVGIEGMELSVDSATGIVVGGAEGVLVGSTGIVSRGVAIGIEAESGKVRWSTPFTYPTDGRGPVVYSNHMDELVYVQVVDSTANQWQSTARQMRILRTDTSGTVLFDSVLNFYVPSLVLTTGQNSLDKDFLIGGVSFQYGDYSGLIIKFKATGELVWMRDYFHQDSTDFALLQNIKELNDLSIIGVGSYINRDTSFQYATSQTWVFGTDSLGCIVPGCQSINIPERAIEIYPFEVYPNPTSGLIKLALDELPSAIRVYDLSGKTVLQKSGVNEIVIPQHLQGVFILQVEIDGEIYRERVVKY